MFRNFRCHWPLLVVTALLVWPALADQPTPKAAEKAANGAASESRSGEKEFIRVRRDEQGESLALETAVIRYVPTASDRDGLYVDLVGAVHIADREYYERLNKLFESYDVLLYELVAPEGKEVPTGDAKIGAGGPISAMQKGLKSILELEFQLEHIDYTRKNFVHADMSPEEFSKSMEQRDESFLKMVFRMMGNNAVVQARATTKPGGADLLLALFAKDRAMRLKRVMAEQFEDLELAMAGISGPEGSTIVTERNKKALAELERQIAAGKKKIGIFYGAAHLPDLEKRLLEDFGMKRAEVRWISAWSLQSKPRTSEK